MQVGLVSAYGRAKHCSNHQSQQARRQHHTKCQRHAHLCLQRLGGLRSDQLLEWSGGCFIVRVREERAHCKWNQYRHQHQRAVSPSIEKLTHARLMRITGGTVVTLVALPGAASIKERECADEPEENTKVLLFL